MKDLYEILGLTPHASEDDIKSAFRKSAHRFHPDRNEGSTESAAMFRIVHNAYTILSDSEWRGEYDSYLRTSSVFRRSTGGSAKQHADRPSLPSGADTLETLLSHLNSILWDMEDLIREQPDWNLILNGFPLQHYVLDMLRFIDTWILSLSGYPDYFYQARKIDLPLRTAAAGNIQFTDGSSGHRPFVNLSHYFYDIRLRTDKFISSAGLIDFIKPLPGEEVSLIDCVLEVHNYCSYTLGYIRNALAGNKEQIPRFRHSHPCFET